MRFYKDDRIGSNDPINQKVNPDYKTINDFVMSVNERVVKGEI